MDDCKRVLVGCEYSGVVRRAFEAIGWIAYSCDILPSEDRWKERSRTFSGIAQAMAEQWGRFIEECDDER